MEVARTRLCIAVVDLGRGPSGRRVRFGLHSTLKSDWTPHYGQELYGNVGVMNQREIDRCPSEIDRREGRPAIFCKIVQGRFSLAGERNLLVRMCGRTWSLMLLQALSHCRERS